MSWDRLNAEQDIPGLLVAMGGSRKLSAVVKFGANFTIQTAGVPCTLTTAVASGIYPYPVAPVSLEILSDDAADADPSGAGLRTVTVLGLDASWALQSQDVALNGETPANIPGTWIRVFRIEGLLAGALPWVNLGTLTVRPQGGGTTLLNVLPGYSQTMHCSFTIPDGYVGFLKAASADLLPSTAVAVSGAHVGLITRENDVPGRPFRTRNTAGVPVRGTNVIPRLLESKTDVELRAIDVEKNSTQIAGSFELVLRGKEEKSRLLPNIID